jgi:hypothetical protein|tara:strand:- start:5 stop:409 length:405 start_codon:yes stop_codon:yes gene_type:complete
MEDDFYASLKLISGEEVFAKVAACDEDNRTLLLLHNPVKVEQVKLPGGNITAGYKVEPWLKTSNEDMMVLDMKNIMTMVECNDIEMITIHQRYVADSAEQGTRSRIDRKMGYISSVADAKKMLEKLYQEKSKDS